MSYKQFLNKLITESKDLVEEGEYSYKEWAKLNPSIAETIIEKFQSEGLDYEWWVGAYDYFISEMKKKYAVEIDEDDIEFSGFWSQGDGASFVCDLDQDSIVRILKENKDNKIYVDWLEFIEDFSFSMFRSGRYVHEMSVGLDFDGGAYTIDNDPTKTLNGIKKFALKYKIDKILNLPIEAKEEGFGESDDDTLDWLNEYYAEYFLEEVENILEEWRIDKCKELYKLLESDYEGLTSKKAIIETVTANDYIFDKNGNIV